MNDMSSALSVAQRLIHVLDHFGLPKAHFGLRYPADLVGLLEHAPARVASVVLQGATGRPEAFAPVAAHTLWVLGDAGPSGQMRARLEALSPASVHWITHYPEFLWSDTAVDHTEEVASTMLQFLQRMDAEDTLPPVSLSGAGEVAGVTYAAAGRGTPVVLLPLGLSSQQWTPVLPHLQAHHCTIVLSGPYLKPVEQLESRAAGGYTRMALHLLDLAMPHAGAALIEVGCGTGALLRRIVRHTGMPRVTGLDMNGFLLKEAQALAVQEGLGERLLFKQGSAVLVAGGMILRGWALAQRYAEPGAEQEQREAGIAQMQQGLTAWRATGAAVFQPYGLALLAAASAQVGRHEGGLTLLAEALALTNDREERRWEAEVYRLQGEVLLARSAGYDTEAETCFRQALAVARRQQAKSWELRATLSLSRLWQQQGKQDEAHELLAPLYGWFTEGFDTTDLQEVKALLDELES